MAEQFTYPFCYVPDPRVVSEAEKLISILDSGHFDHSGKMFGILITDRGPLYAFSGLLDGRAVVDGFVPPIYDYTSPVGYFRRREAEIAGQVARRRAGLPASEDPARMSAELQDWLFEQYKVHNAKGECLSIKEIFSLRGLVPPGGTGECAGPKLLNYAYLNGMKPLAMGEFWYGDSPQKEVREQGRFYPSCMGKCGPLLTWMLQGIDVAPNPLDAGFSNESEPEVLYVDENLIVVNKPAGMLAVPGRVAAPSLLGWLRERYGESVETCHRLDMDTSGLMVFARDMATKSAMEAQFAGHEVVKKYRARLVAGAEPFRHAARGTIALPLALDYYDRPRQCVDYENGKLAVTGYEIAEILPNGEIDVIFTPKTGRTHQLRVHSAHSKGLGRPIKGDRLYGDATPGRLFLHAFYLEFTHPLTSARLVFDQK